MNHWIGIAGIVLHIFAMVAFIRGMPVSDALQLFIAGTVCFIYADLATLRRQITDRDKLLRDDFGEF